MASPTSRLDSAELQRRIELCDKFRQALKVVVTLALAFGLLSCYSIAIVSRDAPEFYISVLTLVLCVVLSLSALFAGRVLRRTQESDAEQLRQSAQKDAVDPWKL